MKQLQFLIKPASSLCNMRCRYCFYADEAASRETPSAGVMAPALRDALLDAAFEAADPGADIAFSFQGGEPTLAGLDFFRAFAAGAKARNAKGCRLSWAIQTNGLALDGQWAAFLKENDFLVGLSLDGDKAVHDGLRPDAAGKGTWNRAVKNLGLLQRAGVQVNALCVVSRQCARSPVKVYNSLKKLGLGFLQFIPCLDPLDRPRGQEFYSLTPAAYGEFLCALFDEWYRDWAAGRYVSVRHFDDCVHMAMGQRPTACAARGECGGYFVVEGDGSLYPCDFFCLDEWKLGTVGREPLEALARGETMARFFAQSARRPEKCAGCRWQALCNGGCPRDREYLPAGARNYYCAAFEKFFDHAASRLAQIARAELACR